MLDAQRRKLDAKIKDDLLTPGLREQLEHRLDAFEANISGNYELLFSPAYRGGSMSRILRLNISIANSFEKGLPN